MDQDAGHAGVGDGQLTGLTVFHLKVVRGIVQLIALRGFNFHGIVGSILQGEEHPAILIRGYGVH